jgi:hypothetical protein
MVLNAHLPKSFGRAMISQFEADRRFVLLKFPWSDFDIKTISPIRNFKNLGPSKSVDPKPVIHKFKE